MPSASALGLRIVYMGTPEFAVPPLRALVESGYNVVGVVTSPDRPAGRGLQMQQSAVKQYAVEAGLNVLQPEKLRDEAFVEQFLALDADLGIVIAFRMLPEIIWSAPRLGTFNLHASLLPQYRGAAPINHAIINGERITGLTTFMLNHQIDQGAIIARHEIAILPEDNFGTLHDRLMAAGPQLVEHTVEAIASGASQPIEQGSIPESELKPAPKIFRENCRIDFSLPGERIVNLIRGLSPYPAAWSELRKLNSAETQALPVKIFSGNFIPGIVSTEPGSVTTDSKTFFRVACADGHVEITDLQLSGKKRMGVRDFLIGLHDPGQYRF